MSARDLAGAPDGTLLAAVGAMDAAVHPAPPIDTQTLAAARRPVLPVHGCAQHALNQTIAAATSPTVYTVALPAGLPLLNANQIRKMHWSTERRIARGIVDAAIVMTRKVKVPRLERVVISAVYHPSDRRKLDPHNWSPSVKAATDGVVRSGALADDDFEHVTDGGITLGAPVKGGQLVIHITPIGGNS